MGNNKCSICYENIGETNSAHTSCNHLFHFSCILKNMKLNSNTGYKCPLCRKEFIPNVSSNTFHQPNVSSNTFHQPNLTEIIRQRRIRAALARRSLISSNRIQRHQHIREEIKSYINNLNFDQLKSKLREKNVSSRGYLRTSLEKRLFEKMVSERIVN
jgi:hypothetical protein